MNEVQTSAGRAVKITAFSTSVVVLLVLQVFIFSVVTDLMTSMLLIAVSFMAGRMSK